MGGGGIRVDELVARFTLPFAEAALKLRVSPQTLVSECKAHGISSWPDKVMWACLDVYGYICVSLSLSLSLYVCVLYIYIYNIFIDVCVCVRVCVCVVVVVVVVVVLVLVVVDILTGPGLYSQSHRVPCAR